MSDARSRRLEALSALMDGEVDEMELRRTLKDISEDPEMLDRWHRFQLASAAMRNELPDQLVDFSASVRSAIDLESKPSVFTQHFMKPIGRFAVAASVMVVAVFGVQQFNQPQQSGVNAPLAVVENTETDMVPVQLPSAFQVPQLPLRTVSATTGGGAQQRQVVINKQAMPDKATQEQIQAYLNELMLRHTENAALNTNQGMLPFARMPQKQPE